MERKTIIVTGIGGNVGQGVLRNILAEKLNVRLVGVNISPISAGNHWVDASYTVPYGYEESYIPTMVDIVKKESADLIIPTTDYETYFLSTHQDKIPCKVACSGPISSALYLDKYHSWEHHNIHNIPFAESFLPSQYQHHFPENIAKPRKGRGSKGLIFNCTDCSPLQDEEYMIQRLYAGTEITTAVYCRYNDGEVHGLLSMVRTLENGATTYCKVIKDYDEQFMEIAKKMAVHSDIRGSFNIQSIVTEKGLIMPFEVNCRISGTNSIRSSFGFKDVLYTVEELLWNKMPNPIHTKEGVAYRFLSDVIYTYDDNQQLIGNNQDSFIEF